MITAHKNKTLATFLAAFFGGIGAHRFYLHGKKDRGAWLYVILFVLSILAGILASRAIGLPQGEQWDAAHYVVLLPLSVFAGFIAALSIGLTLDDKWDAAHNQASGRKSDSGWTVVLTVIVTFFVGTTLLIAAIARFFDLVYTGGAYG